MVMIEKHTKEVHVWPSIVHREFLYLEKCARVPCIYFDGDERNRRVPSRY